jgi:hypothetical protein
MQRSDFSFPEETRIYYSFPYTVLFLFLGALAFGVVAALGFYFQETEGVWFSIVVSLLLFGLAYWQLRERKPNEPPIILNKHGIKVAGYDFAEWQHIRYERVSSSTDSVPDLCFDNKGTSVSYPLIDLKVKDEELAQMLIFYRKASGQK